MTAEKADRSQSACAESGVRPRRRWGQAAIASSKASEAEASDCATALAGQRALRRWSGGDDAHGERKETKDIVEPVSAGVLADAELLVGDAHPLSSLTAGAAAAAALAAERRRQALRAGNIEAIGVRLAEELFHPKMAMLSYQTRGDLSALGQTTTTLKTQKLSRDFQKIAEGNAVYWPECLCSAKDLSIFKALHEELAPWERSPYRRSRHPACVEEEKLLRSATYRRIVAELRDVFDLKVGYSIVNLYTNGNDWTEYHRDNFRAEGNRMTASGEAPSPHNVTVGASFGDARELRFKHLETGMEFGFPQSNGDVFAFTEPVNSAFQHSVPQKAPAASAGPRISVILWGRTEGLLLFSNT